MPVCYAGLFARDGPMKNKLDRAPRIKTYLAGRVKAGRIRAETCVIENVSSGGARLKLRTSVSLPETFCLHILKWRETYRVRLAWRDGQSAGVQFRELLHDGERPTCMTSQINRAALDA